MPRPPSIQSPAGLFRTTVLWMGEWLLVALALFAMDAFAHLRLEPRQFLIAWVGWGVVLLVARGIQGRTRLSVWSVGFAEILAPGVLLSGLHGWGRGGFSLPQILYVLVLVAVLIRGWRAGAAWLTARGGDVAGDAVRVLLVGGSAVAVTSPLFTDLLVGGTDARWYAYMLGDFVAQLRAGVFPVFVGQGELAWNGGVHPFRSAPVYMHVAGLWDFLTLRALSTCALQHLAAITAALVGGLGMYAAGIALVPRRRWEAAAVALLYLSVPASLEAFYNADAYMTWMAVAVLPLVFFGNARVLLAADGRGYLALATGVALAWVCHPPIAMLASMATLLLQGGGLLCGDVTPARLRGVALGGLVFAGLGAYYFYGMSELPVREANNLLSGDVVQMGGLALWLAGLAGAVLRRRGSWWWLLLVPGGWMLWISRVPWFWWMGTTALLVSAVVGLSRWRRWFDPARHAIVVLLPCALLAAGIVQAWLGPKNPARDPRRLQDLSVNAAAGFHYLLPLSPSTLQQGDWQPGLGLSIVLGLLAVSFFCSRSLPVKLWFAVALLPVFTFVRVPWVSEFIVGYAPRWFGGVSGLTLMLRLMPAFAAVLAMGWFVWMATEPARGKGARVLAGLVLSVACSWGGFEASKIVRRGFQATATRAHTEKQFRSENVVLESFAYDLVPEPTYYSHGATDPRMEVRLLDAVKRVQIGPDVTAHRMEEAGHTELKLQCLAYQPPAPDWLMLGPSLTLAPGEHVLLRFEFDATKNYSGYLFLISASARCYREYALPESGLRRAFGTTAKASRVISLWNSGTVAEKYEFSFRRGAGCTLPSDGSPFANVVVSHYDPSRAPVRVDSLQPYRVTAAMDWPGFVETSRVWIPGYEATVDGKPALVRSSVERMAMVPVPAGLHTVELRYVGTTGLWVAGWISALTWGGLLGFCAWRMKQKS